MPLILGLLSVLGVGGLVYKTIADETEQVVEKAGPNIAVIMALAIAGYVVFQTVKGRGA